MATATLEAETRTARTNRTATTMTVGNRTFTTELSAQQASERLVELVENGTIRNSFAADLARQIQHRGWVSPKQIAWVQKFVADIDQPVLPAGGNVPGSVGTGGSNMVKIVEHFTTARENLKYPKIVVTDPETDITLCLKPAGQRSKYFGSIIVTSDRSYDATYYGHIRVDGTFIPAGRAPNEQREVVALLERIAVDPAGELGRLGKASGCCCFCQRELTDDRSTYVGYGPICAKKWGLVWGEKNEKSTTANDTDSGATSGEGGAL